MTRRTRANLRRLGATHCRELIGRRVRLRYDIRSRGGLRMNAGELVLVTGTWRGRVHLQRPGGWSDNIRRVELEALE